MGEIHRSGMPENCVSARSSSDRRVRASPAVRAARRVRWVPASRSSRGFAALEALLALPIVLFAGLSALQFGLVLHARQAVQHSATEAVRSGAVGHAAPRAIEAGLARGLSPWLYGADGAADHLAAVARTQAHLIAGQAAGWVRWRQLSPTQRSFDDWAVPSLDAQGLPLPDSPEIPTDNLVARGLRSDPRVGASSGQTLADATLLKIEFTYGVPLTVPLAGRLGAWVMRSIDGCAAAQERRLGALSLGLAPTSPSPRAWTCDFYDARDAGGRALPRWPVRVSSTARLQQPARHAGNTPDDQALAEAASLGIGEVALRPLVPPRPQTPGPGEEGPSGEGGRTRDDGFLQLGGQTPWPAPGVCMAP